MYVSNCYRLFDLNNKLKDGPTLVVPGNFLMKLLGNLPGGIFT